TCATSMSGRLVKIVFDTTVAGIDPTTTAPTLEACYGFASADDRQLPRRHSDVTPGGGRPDTRTASGPTSAGQVEHPRSGLSSGRFRADHRRSHEARHRGGPALVLRR